MQRQRLQHATGLGAPAAPPGHRVIADALHTQRETARHILDDGLHDILTVQGNRPQLLEQLRDDYRWTVAGRSEARLGHGRIERRTLRGPHHAPSGVREDGPPTGAGDGTHRDRPAARAGHLGAFAAVVRLHWGAVGNGVHDGRDTALGEDACRVRQGALPRVPAAFANLAISVLRLLGQTNLARAMDNLRLRPRRALTVVAAVSA